MVDERESPSAGWREVYDEMGVEQSAGDGGDRADDSLEELLEVADAAARDAHANHHDRCDDASASGDCPECGRSLTHVRGRVYRCDVHGRWLATG